MYSRYVRYLSNLNLKLIFDYCYTAVNSEVTHGHYTE